jgi:hypothetical protein
MTALIIIMEAEYNSHGVLMRDDTPMEADTVFVQPAAAAWGK